MAYKKTEQINAIVSKTKRKKSDYTYHSLHLPDTCNSYYHVISVDSTKKLKYSLEDHNNLKFATEPVIIDSQGNICELGQGFQVFQPGNKKPILKGKKVLSKIIIVQYCNQATIFDLSTGIHFYYNCEKDTTKAAVRYLKEFLYEYSRDIGTLASYGYLYVRKRDEGLKPDIHSYYAKSSKVISNLYQLAKSDAAIFQRVYPFKMSKGAVIQDRKAISKGEYIYLLLWRGEKCTSYTDMRAYQGCTDIVSVVENYCWNGNSEADSRTSKLGVVTKYVDRQTNLKVCSNC